MKIEDTRKAYQEYSKAASDVTRELAFAGIAVIWIFRITNAASGVPGIPATLHLPLVLFVVALGVDLLHYATGTVIWGTFGRFKERQEGVTRDTVFLAPRQLNWPTLVLFWTKLIVLGIGYVFLLSFLVRTLRTAASGES